MDTEKNPEICKSMLCSHSHTDYEQFEAHNAANARICKAGKLNSLLMGLIPQKASQLIKRMVTVLDSTLQMYFVFV